MKLKMKDTRTGSEDGYKLATYHEGQTYDVGETLGCYFVNRGYATKIITENFEQAFERIKAELRAERLPKEAA